MEPMLKLQHEVETCVALACAVGAMLCEIADEGSTQAEKMENAGRVMALLQDRLDAVKVMADSAILSGLA